jgi:hypothetical protein
MTKLDVSSDPPGSARVVHELTLRFDEFGWETLESEAVRVHKTLDTVVARAAAHYDAELRTERAALLAPKFKRGRGMPRELRIELPPGRWERLQAEARRQGVRLERLLEHAALLHLADVEAGDVAKPVLGHTGKTGGS